jgi:hypothetical protein
MASDLDERRSVVAWLLDRREQYPQSSGTYDAISQLAGTIARGDHAKSAEHGELDDLFPHVERMMRTAP